MSAQRDRQQAVHGRHDSPRAGARQGLDLRRRRHRARSLHPRSSYSWGRHLVDTSGEVPPYRADPLPGHRGGRVRRHRHLITAPRRVARHDTTRRRREPRQKSVLVRHRTDLIDEGSEIGDRPHRVHHGSRAGDDGSDRSTSATGPTPRRAQRPVSAPTREPSCSRTTTPGDAACVGAHRTGRPSRGDHRRYDVN